MQAEQAGQIGDALEDGVGAGRLERVAVVRAGQHADAGRGRPYPDLPLTALLRTETNAVEAMVVVGDTVSDIESGVAAGAGLVVGVLTGAHDRDALEAAGADAVLESIADLPGLLGLHGE